MVGSAIIPILQKKMSHMPQATEEQDSGMTHPRALDPFRASACCNIVLNSIVLVSRLGFPQKQALEERNLGQGVVWLEISGSTNEDVLVIQERKACTHSYSWGQLGFNWGIF